MSERNKSCTAAEKLTLLGHPPEARLLIVNGDDLGMCHAVNAGTFEALESGIMTSASLMMPCPWAYDAGTYLRAHPDLDVGVHLTVNCEWERYRWGPVLGPVRCPSLVDRWGFFYTAEDKAFAQANAGESMAEAEAQIRRALDSGLDPTHLDGHVRTFYAQPSHLAVYIELARRYHLPLRIPPRRTYEERGAAALYDGLNLEGLLTNDDLRFVELESPPALRDQLFETLRTLQPGITEVVLHAAVPTPEAEAVMLDWPARAEALRLMKDDTIRQEIERLGIVLVGWRTLRAAQHRAARKTGRSPGS
jgi:chitin disaccharide deacetylase